MKEDMHVTEMLPEYALNCLAAEETIRVAEHIRVCRECREELETFQEVTDQLALAVPQQQAPSHLKARILDQIQPITPSSSEDIWLQRWWQRITTFFRPAAPVWAFASILLILVLGGSTFFLWQRIDRLEQYYHTADYQMVKLECTHIVPEATGQVIISKDGEYGMLAAAHLPVLQQDQVYQVWLIRDGRRESAGTFTVNQQGYGMLKIASPQSLLDCAIYITVEPVEGSVEPTGHTVLKTMI